MELGEEGEVWPTPAGRIASVYYLQHTTMALLGDALSPTMSLHVRTPIPHTTPPTLLACIAFCPFRLTAAVTGCWLLCCVAMQILLCYNGSCVTIPASS